jgi:hypothetical protein
MARSGTTYDYVSLHHKPGSVFDEALLSGDENAVVDFRYTASPRLTWWFDHHQSAFADEDDREHFLSEQKQTLGAPRKFFDPFYVSCTGFIADMTREQFGFDTSELRDLIHWANIIDGAKFESADAAVGMAAPALKLMMAIEGTSDPAFIPRLIPLLTTQSLATTLQESFVQDQVGPLLEKHHENIRLLRSRASVDAGVITFDITDQPNEGYSKFIPYYLLPEAVYTVGLSRSSFRTKISVGTSPWTTVPASKLANIAAICQRYGGGGHARVGAISLPVEELAEGRRIAAEIIAELKALGQRNTLTTDS